jgi:hypothetical protein
VRPDAIISVLEAWDVMENVLSSHGVSRSETIWRPIERTVSSVTSNPASVVVLETTLLITDLARVLTSLALASNAETGQEHRDNPG